MKAYIPAIPGRGRRALSQVVLVADGAQLEIVAVWWRLDRPRRYRCSIHGTRTITDPARTKACEHITAARPVLAQYLL